MMDKGAVLARLLDHQRTASAILRDAEPLLRDPARRDVPALARARWTLVRTLTAYQLFKHREIFDPAIGRGLLIEAGSAERMKRACIAVGDEFRTYVSTWSGRDVAAQWDQYQPAALAMMARLRAHLDRERQDVEALVGMAS